MRSETTNTTRSPQDLGQHIQVLTHALQGIAGSIGMAPAFVDAPQVFYNYMYWNLRCQVEQMMAQNPSHAGLLWSYGEVIYRISVLETCQSFCKSAPQTTDPNCLRGHYQMVDAFIQCMTQERRYGPDRGPNTANERNSAQNNLALVVTDYRSRFSSFNASAPDQYASAISRAISAVLAVWLQFRNTFVPIPDPKEEMQK